MTFQYTNPLNGTKQYLRKSDVDLLKRLTNINNDEELQQHISTAQKEAYSIHPYECIRRLTFTGFKIGIHPAYEAILELGQKRENAIFLDFACCVGSDSRKVVADGYPIHNVLASDLHADFWEIGHKLFKTTSDTYPVSFLQGDIFDPAFLQPGIPPAPSSLVPLPVPPLTSVTSLNQLQHRISVIYNAYFFHLFDVEKQAQVARLFASLLSPLPGSMIVGIHMAAAENSDRRIRLTDKLPWVFAHSPSSFKEMWCGESGVFRSSEVDVKVDVTVHEVDGSEGTKLTLCRHLWSVTRL